MLLQGCSESESLRRIKTWLNVLKSERKSRKRSNPFFHTVTYLPNKLFRFGFFYPMHSSLFQIIISWRHDISNILSKVLVPNYDFGTNSFTCTMTEMSLFLGSADQMLPIINVCIYGQGWAFLKEKSCHESIFRSVIGAYCRRLMHLKWFTCDVFSPSQ